MSQYQNPKSSVAMPVRDLQGVNVCSGVATIFEIATDNL